jgi:hypothetical protein
MPPIIRFFVHSMTPYILQVGERIMRRPSQAPCVMIFAAALLLCIFFLGRG